MGHVIRKWIPAVISLLCVIIVFASLDRVPDPPAVKPQHIAGHASSFDIHFEDVSNPASLSAVSASAPHASPSLLVLKQIFKIKIPVFSAPMMRQAADASPPSITG